MLPLSFKKLPLLALGLLIIGAASLPLPVQAQTAECNPDDELAILSLPYWYDGLQCEDGGEGGVVFTDLADIWIITANVLSMLIQVAGLIAVFMIIYGGIRYMTSQGEPENIQAAKKTLMYAIGGLILAILASTLVGFIAGQF